MRRACLLALSFMFILTPNLPVMAETPAPTAADTDSEPTEHREMREERRKLFAEHEALDNESDRLKVECMDAKGQDRSDCEEKKHALQDKRLDLHRRLKEFHDKVETAHKEWLAHHQQSTTGQTKAQPAPQPQP